MSDVEWDVLILPLNVRAPPLKEPAIQENSLAVDAYDVARACHFSGCAVELDLHLAFRFRAS